MKIFVIHYTKLLVRKAEIIKQFEKHHITDYDFIESHDQENLTDDDVAMLRCLHSMCLYR